jgi:hypothetical protein
MAKKSLIEKEKRRNLYVTKFYKLRHFLKGKIESSFSFEEKLFYHSQLQKLPRNSSLIRLFWFILS